MCPLGRSLIYAIRRRSQFLYAATQTPLDRSNAPRERESAYARARCVVTAEIERSVACGGFAAEFYLLNNGYAERGQDDARDISQIVFHNATGDREEYWGRKLGKDEAFSKAEDEAFMNHAIGSVAPIFDQYFPGMQELVRVLCDAKRVEGRRVKELLSACRRA